MITKKSLAKHTAVVGMVPPEYAPAAWNTGVFEYNLPIDIATATTTTITSIVYSYIIYHIY